MRDFNLKLNFNEFNFYKKFEFLKKHIKKFLNLKNKYKFYNKNIKNFQNSLIFLLYKTNLFKTIQEIKFEIKKKNILIIHNTNKIIIIKFNKNLKNRLILILLNLIKKNKNIKKIPNFIDFNFNTFIFSFNINLLKLKNKNLLLKNLLLNKLNLNILKFNKNKSLTHLQNQQNEI